MERVQGWHFLAYDKRLRYGDDRKIEVGKTYTQDYPHKTAAGIHNAPKVCFSGMHMCIRAIEALKYAPGPIICKVEIWGDLYVSGDKMAARHRKVITMADATRLLRIFACDVAEQALIDAKIDDTSMYQSINVKRAWVDGLVGDKVLEEARKAANRPGFTGLQEAAWVAADRLSAFAAREAILLATNAEAMWKKQNQMLEARLNQLLFGEPNEQA